jgi:alpha-N-acetylglucosaminidase
MVDRARALGMTTVFKAWDGTVPPAFRKRFPAAQVQCHYGNAAPRFTCQLPSFDPLFASIGEAYLRVMKRLYGMDHGHWIKADLYSQQPP